MKSRILDRELIVWGTKYNRVIYYPAKFIDKTGREYTIYFTASEVHKARDRSKYVKVPLKKKWYQFWR